MIRHQDRAPKHSINRALNCSQARGFFEPLADGELDEDRSRQTRVHLTQCSKCRTVWDDQRRSQSLIHQAVTEHPRIATPPDFDAAVWQRLELESTSARPVTRVARLIAFAARPIPRLFGSAIFGLCAALAIGGLASLNADPAASSAASSQTTLSAPPSTLLPDSSLSALYAMEQRGISARRLDLPEPKEAPQVLAPGPTGQSHFRPENQTWTNPSHPARAARFSDAGSLC